MKIVRITAMWCMSCLAMKKVWKKLFKDYPNIEIKDLDYDFDSDEIKKYHVGSILPILIVFNDNKEVIRVIGEKSKKEMFKIFEGLNEKD